MIDFDKLQVVAVEETDTYGKFEIGPVARGFGVTLANPFRRVLLSSLSGAAVTSVKIGGVKHEYTTMKGLSEDILEVVLNVKGLVVSSHSEVPVTMKLEAKGAGIVTAKQFKAPAEIEIIDPEYVIANLTDDKASFSLEVTIEQGVGYLLADGYDRSKIGVIPVDANFSPIVRVSFKVEDARVGRRTDFDKVVIELFTNGSVKPSDCMTEAAEILVKMYAALAGESKLVKRILENKDVPVIKEEESTEDEVEILKLTELDLSTRALNSLMNAGLKTTTDLIRLSTSDIESIEGLGKKSVDDIEKALAKQGLGLK